MAKEKAFTTDEAGVEKKTRAPRKPTPKSAAIALRKAEVAFVAALSLAREQGLEFDLDCSGNTVTISSITLVERF
jgi:hypothetical protein